MKDNKKAVLLLEDGSLFEGRSIGVAGERSGEVVLDTAVVGYQEMMTDPTNAGKILVLTYPLIGNYGVADKFYESETCRISGLVIKEQTRIYSNWQAEGSFADFLKDEGVLTISGIDTRTLAVRIRDHGEMFGIISTANMNRESLIKKLRSAKKEAKKDFISRVSAKKIADIKGGPSRPKVAILDLGILNSFVRQLETLGCSITLLPYDTPAEEIIKIKPDGLVISNGPEDDMAVPEIAKTVKRLLGVIPIMGISTGHEIIGLALGGRVTKMRIGHHGVNYPVKPADSFKGQITVQNHSFVVDENSVKHNKDTHVTLRNLNDHTVEAMENARLKFISTQYYPASPGFDEVNEAFIRFFRMMGHPKNTAGRPGVSDREAQHAKA